MGFDIDGGNIGFIGAVMIVFALSAAIIGVIFLVATVRQARASVLEDKDTDLGA